MSAFTRARNCQIIERKGGYPMADDAFDEVIDPVVEQADDIVDGVIDLIGLN